MEHKCILLSRVSTYNQTLEQQTNELIVEAHKIGYSDDNIIKIEDHESAIKLSESERLGLKRMYDAINSDSSIDCVICYEVSRLSRRPKDLYSIRDFLVEHNVQLVILKPYLRLLDNDGKISQSANIMFSLFSSLSESEMMLKKERMTRGKNKKISECKYVGGHIALGYKFDSKKNIVIDEEGANIVKQIFDMCENGDSTYKIAKYMYERGMIEGKTIENAVAKVGQALRRKSYTGEAEHGYPYPQIISKEQFERCQQMRNDNRKPHSKTSVVYYCKSLLFNKANMRMLTPCKSTTTYSSYNYGTGESISINMNYIDSIVWQAVKEHLSNVDVGKRIAEAKVKEKEIHQKIGAIDKKMNTYDEQEERIERRIIEGKMSETRGDAMLNEIYMAKSDLELDKDKLLHEETNIMNELIYMNSFLYDGTGGYDKCTTEDDEERREIIVGQVEKILLSKTDIFGVHNCEIMFKDSSCKKLLLIRQNRYYKVKDENGDDYKFEFIERIKRKRYGREMK